MIRGFQVEAIYRPGATKWRHIKLFADQQKFFYFNNETSLQKTFELLLKK